MSSGWPQRSSEAEFNRNEPYKIRFVISILKIVLDRIIYLVNLRLVKLLIMYRFGLVGMYERTRLNFKHTKKTEDRDLIPTINRFYVLT